MASNLKHHRLSVSLNGAQATHAPLIWCVKNGSTMNSRTGNVELFHEEKGGICQELHSCSLALRGNVHLCHIPKVPMCRSGQAAGQRHFQQSPSIGRKRSRSPGPSQQQPAISGHGDGAFAVLCASHTISGFALPYFAYAWRHGPGH